MQKCGRQFTLLCHSCKEWQRNEQRIITHVYTATVHVADTVVASNERQNNEQLNERKTNESTAGKKDGQQCRKRLRYETSLKNQNI